MDRKEIRRIIDEIIEKSNEIKDLQCKINNGIVEDEKSIVVYSEDNLIEYAEAVGENVEESGYVSSTGSHHIRFIYKGYEFSSYVTYEELLKIREKVLAPTKVTEPNQNA